MPTSRSYHSYLIESLKDPHEAAAYLAAVLEDGNYEELNLALRNVTEARLSSLGGSQSVAEQESQESIQQTLSDQVDLDLSTLLRLLDELGFKLSVTPKERVA
jgi:DNA-binding phage protein